jgi:AcrR family transcriptional regulator
MATDTRQRILGAAMRLFGEQGFSATTIAQVESAAGLSPGSGGLYKHFASKDELLSAGIRGRIEDRGDLFVMLQAPPGGVPVEAMLQRIAALGLDRLDDERDLNRILVKDLAGKPELLEFFRTAELRTTHAALSAVLDRLGAGDPDGLAAILIDAMSHYWLMTDIYGGVHPLGIERERYLAALAALAAKGLER